MLTKKLIDDSDNSKLELLLTVLAIPNNKTILELLDERGFNRGEVIKKENKKLKILIENFLEKPTDLNLDIITNSVGNERVLIKFTMTDGDEKYLTYSTQTVENFASLIEDILITEEETIQVSDGFIDFTINNVSNVEVFDVPDVINQDGGFFPYINIGKDLSRYQIYKTIPDKIEHCLIYSLELLGINTDAIKPYMRANIKKRDLKNICKILNINIDLAYYDKNNKMRRSKYGKGKKVNLALFKGHYFVHEKRNLLKIRKMFDDGKFISSQEIVSKVKYGGEVNSLKYIDSEQQLYKRDMHIHQNTKIIDGDLETIVCEGKHKLLLSGYRYHDKTTIINNEDYKKTLDSIIKLGGKKFIIYYHNLKYDWNIIFKDIECITSICEKDGVLYNAKIWYKGCNFEFRDFYKMLAFPLSKIPKLLKLGIEKKEYINYEIYTTENRKLRTIPIPDFSKEALNDEIVKKYIVDGRYRHMDHYKYYLNYDCKVLQAARLKLREALLEATKLDLHNFLTISSLADYYMYKEGVYENIYEVKGGLREFIMKCVIGGRVCTKDNKKWNLTVPLNDYDACSLYPSAMKEKAYPAGKAIIMTEIKNYQYYCCKIKVISTGKNQQIPFMTYKDGQKRIYSNEMDGKILYVDKYTLEDYCEFHEMKYEFIEGVYWNETNNKIQKVIQHLYDERLKYKKTNQALQMSLKLLMNSSYGKTILKESKYKVKVVKNLEKYVSKNYNQLVEAKKYGKNYLLKTLNNKYEHYNRAHIGCSILSISKRIMNQVMGLANDNDIEIYYQDTDSMHIVDSKVEKLETLFKEKYDRELKGGKMGQFHCDFDFPGKNLRTKKSIILGKKAYFDLVINDEGQEFNHCRLKGVNKAALSEYKDKEVLYSSLYHGTEINFDLLYDGAVSFDFNNGIITRDKFERNVKFL